MTESNITSRLQEAQRFAKRLAAQIAELKQQAEQEALMEIFREEQAHLNPVFTKRLREVSALPEKKLRSLLKTLEDTRKVARLSRRGAGYCWYLRSEAKADQVLHILKARKGCDSGHYDIRAATGLNDAGLFALYADMNTQGLIKAEVCGYGLRLSVTEAAK